MKGKLSRNGRGSGKAQNAAYKFREDKNKKNKLLKQIRQFPNDNQAKTLAKTKRYL